MYRLRIILPILIAVLCFTAFTGVVPCADVACREIAGLVREGLEGRIARAAS